MDQPQCRCGFLTLDNRAAVPPPCSSCPKCASQITAAFNPLPAVPHRLKDGKCVTCGRIEKYLVRIAWVRIERAA